MRRTKNLGLPIYDNPSVDLFKISDFNDTHEKIDKQYEEIQEHIKHEIGSVDLSAYYTKGQTDSRISEEIAKAQLGGEGGEVDLSAYATKTFVEEEINTSLGGKTFKYLTNSQYEGLSDSEKSNTNIVYGIIDGKEAELTLSLNGNILSLMKDGVPISSVTIPISTGEETEPPIIYGDLIVSTTSLSVNEGSTTTFTVKLNQAPTNTQTVNLGVDNSYCTLNTSSLNFTSSNYSTPQTVTVTGVKDDESYENKTSKITISSNNVSSKTITTTIVNTDSQPEEPDEPSSATLVHQWDLSKATTSTTSIIDSVNGLNLSYNGNKFGVDRYTGGKLNDNFRISENDSFTVEIEVTPKNVYYADIFNTGKLAGLNLFDATAGEQKYYRVQIDRDKNIGGAPGAIIQRYYDETGTKNTEIGGATSQNVKTTIKIAYDSNNSTCTYYQDNRVIGTVTQKIYVAGFVFNISQCTIGVAKVYKGI